MQEADYEAGNPSLNGSNKLVVVSGCSSGGKSTLLAEMASRGYGVMPEAGRQVVKEQLYVNGDALPWANWQKFVELCVSRATLFYNSAEPADKPVLFDRSILDTIGGFHASGLPTPAYLSEALLRYRYARRVFFVPPWEALFVNDAERRHSFEDAQAEYQRLLQNYKRNGYEIVEIPKSSVADRAGFLERQLGF